MNILSLYGSRVTSVDDFQVSLPSTEEVAAAARNGNGIISKPSTGMICKWKNNSGA